MIESVSACGWSCTADSTAVRGRVTRRPASRNMRSRSEAVGTTAVLPVLWNRSISLDRPSFGLEECATGGHFGGGAAGRKRRRRRTGPMTGTGVERVTVVRGGTTVLRDVTLHADDGEL